MNFFREFLKRPGTTGAIKPSSRGLAEAMTTWIDWGRTRSVVEYGPGTGVFTEKILSLKRSETRFVAVEVNINFVNRLRDRFPSLEVFHDSVENIRLICNRSGIQEVDVILCGLPWASFSRDVQVRYLTATMSVLGEGSQFGTFAYLQGLLLPAGRRFRRTLAESFDRVTTSPTVWRNLPPAFVYRCWR